MIKLIWKTILLMNFINFIRCDSLDVEERGYLPPVKNTIDKRYLPTKEEDVNGQRLDDGRYLPPVNLEDKRSYQYNKPRVIDDPQAMKVNYIQPLTLDFPTGEYKPLIKGDFIPALFINENNLQLLNSESMKEAPLNDYQEVKVINITKTLPLSKLHTKVYYAIKVLDSDKTKPTDSVQIKKYVKNLPKQKDVIQINRYDDNEMIYVLFNYDDDNELSASAPVVIYKPGDDLNFTEDLTVIDNYEHVFRKKKVKNVGEYNTTRSNITISGTTTTPKLTTKTTYRTTPRSTTRRTIPTTIYTTTNYRTTPRTYSKTTARTTSRTTYRTTTPRTTARYLTTTPRTTARYLTTTTLRNIFPTTHRTTTRYPTTTTLRNIFPTTTPRKITTTTFKPFTSTPLQRQLSYDLYTNKPKQQQTSDDESANNYSGEHGYFYEKPKIPFTF